MRRLRIFWRRLWLRADPKKRAHWRRIVLTEQEAFRAVAIYQYYTGWDFASLSVACAQIIADYQRSKAENEAMRRANERYQRDAERYRSLN